MPLKIQAKSKTEAEVYLYDIIGDFWGEGILAKNFVREINALKVDNIHLHINSPGGNVYDGSSMYNVLRQHKAHIITHIDGLAASAASFVAMAGDEINISDSAFIMIHNPWTMTSGDGEALRKAADDIDLLKDMYAKTYTSRTNGKTKYDSMIAYMREETWFDSKSAVAAGLADAITEPLKIAARFDLERYKYKNIPAQVREKAALPKEAARRARLASMNMAVMRNKPSPAFGRA